MTKASPTHLSCCASGLAFQRLAVSSVRQTQAAVSAAEHDRSGTAEQARQSTAGHSLLAMHPTLDPKMPLSDLRPVPNRRKVAGKVPTQLSASSCGCLEAGANVRLSPSPESRRCEAQQACTPVYERQHRVLHGLSVPPRGERGRPPLSAHAPPLLQALAQVHGPVLRRDGRALADASHQVLHTIKRTLSHMCGLQCERPIGLKITKGQHWCP